MAANMVNVEGAKMIGRSGYIVLDFETTGFPEDGAEVLQVAVRRNINERILPPGACKTMDASASGTWHNTRNGRGLPNIQRGLFA